MSEMMEGRRADRWVRAGRQRNCFAPAEVLEVGRATQGIKAVVSAVFDLPQLDNEKGDGGDDMCGSL
jgi:hypothetical protein